LYVDVDAAGGVVMVPSHPAYSVTRGIEVAVVAGLVGLACLALFATLFLGPGLLPVVFVLALAAFGVEQIGHRGEAQTAIHDGMALGAPEPIVAWGKIAKVVGACPDGETPRKGTTFVVAEGRVWPSICRHAEMRILETAGRMEADDLDEAPARYQDGAHVVDLEMYRAPAHRPASAPVPVGASREAPIARLVESDDSDAAPEPNWLPRAVISGFMATVLMSVLFFVAFASARLLTMILPAGSFLRGWLAGLTTNPVLDLAASGIYVAGTLHLVVGVVWALLYAGVFEPRISGPSWLKGAKFALLPWALSLVVFLPLAGGGIFGLGLDAGPLPAIGNFLLHLVYGASLGAVFGPLGDIPADQFPRTWEPDSAQVTGHEEQAMGRGIVVGALLGAIVGIVGEMIASTSPILGAPPVAFFAVSVLLGATFGCFVGSMAGLGAPPSMRPRAH
jgi:hypothetical protein